MPAPSEIRQIKKYKVPHSSSIFGSKRKELKNVDKKQTVIQYIICFVGCHVILKIKDFGQMVEKKTEEAVKSLRAVLNLTQEQFAAKLGVTVSTVNRWENGKGKPSPLARLRIQEFWRAVGSGDAETEKH